MSTRWQLFWILVAWGIVGAVSLTIQNVQNDGWLLTPIDFIPGVAALAAAGSETTNAGWVDIAIGWVFVLLIFWRLMRSRKARSADLGTRPTGRLGSPTAAHVNDQAQAHADD